MNVKEMQEWLANFPDQDAEVQVICSEGRNDWTFDILFDGHEDRYRYDSRKAVLGKTILRLGEYR